MCGGAHHITGALIGAAINESRHTGHSHSHGSTHNLSHETPTSPSITQEIKLMYARGDIDAAGVHELDLLGDAG